MNDNPKTMNYKRLEPQIDLNDPEGGFSFASENGNVTVSLVDWRARRIRVRFLCPYVFSYRMGEVKGDLPEAWFVEILDSAEIAALRVEGVASEEEELHHYVVSTNEEGWCEVVAEGYVLETVPPSF